MQFDLPIDKTYLTLGMKTEGYTEKNIAYINQRGERVYHYSQRSVIHSFFLA